MEAGLGCRIFAMKSKEWLYGGRTHCPELRCEHLYGWWFTPIVEDHFHLLPIMKIIIYFLISIHLCFSIQRTDEFSIAMFYFIPSQVLWKIHSGSRNLTTSSPSLCKVSLLWNALHIYWCGRLALYIAEDSHQTPMLGIKYFAWLFQICL